MSKHLTAYERETVIVFNDEDDLATVTTHQRRVLTKLRKNPAAVETNDLTFGSTPGARFEIPKGLVSLRTKRKTVVLTPEQQEAARERMKVAQAARQGAVSR